MRRPLELIWQLSFRATTEDSAEDDCAKGNEAKFAKLIEDTILPATAPESRTEGFSGRAGLFVHYSSCRQQRHRVRHLREN
jgi:hypothetical protein